MECKEIIKNDQQHTIEELCDSSLFLPMNYDSLVLICLDLQSAGLQYSILISNSCATVTAEVGEIGMQQ